MRPIFLLLMLFVVGSGCASYDIDAQQAHLANLRSQCESFGFTPKSDDFSRCLQQQASIAEQSRRESSARMRELGLAMMQPGFNWSTMSGPRLTCQSNQLNGGVQTMCY